MSDSESDDDIIDDKDIDDNVSKNEYDWSGLI